MSMSRSHARRSRSRWMALILLVTVAFVASSMTAVAGRHHGGDQQARTGNPSTQTGKTKKLKKAPGVPADVSAQAVACAPVTINARILVLTVPGDDAVTTLPAIQSTLDFLGTPYDVMNAAQLTGGLTADMLANGCNAFYQAVLLTGGELAYNSPTTDWASAFTPADWQTLWTYEATFGIRQVAWYTYPTADLEGVMHFRRAAV